MSSEIGGLLGKNRLSLFNGKLSANNIEQSDLKNLKATENSKRTNSKDPTAINIQNAVDTARQARDAVADLRQEQSELIENIASGTALSSQGDAAIDRLAELETEISRIKDISYQSGINPFSTSSQTLGEDSRDSSGVSLAGYSSNFNLGTYTSGVTALSASAATSLESLAQAEAFNTRQDTNNAGRAVDTAKNLEYSQAEESIDSLSGQLSFEDAENLAKEISSDLIRNFGATSPEYSNKAELLEQTISGISNLDNEKASALLQS